MHGTLLGLCLLGVAAAVVSGHYWCPSPGPEPFNCPKLPSPPPASDVRKLRPGNIAAVMALGDSITAGFAMKDGPVEYRGSVYAVGGDEGALTIGNFIKFYNPDVKGLCTGDTIPLVKTGKGLNFAVSMAQVHNVPDQIDELVQHLQLPEYRDVIDQWKLLTLFIGANDVCSCHSTTPESFEAQLRTVMTKIQKEIPKVFVNVMTIFNISQVWNDHDDSRYCEIAVPVLHECGCLNSNASDRLRMDELGLQINAVTRKVVADYAALGEANFTAVVQPGVDELAFGSYNKTVALDFLSGLDCFHPSLCADQGMALAIWNNMFAPPARKAQTIDPFDGPTAYCPSIDDVIQ